MVSWLVPLFFAAAFPPGSVVLGLSRVDGTETEIVVVAPTGERELLGTLAHARGALPRGVVLEAADGPHLVTAARVPDDTHAVLEDTQLAGGARRVLATDVLATHAPTRDASGAWLAVRQEREGAFAIVRVDEARATVVARLAASWVTPARGAPGRFLVVDGARTRIAALDRDALVTTHVLGAGAWRAPVVRGSDVVAERVREAGRATLERAGDARVLGEGLAGLDPLPCGDGLVWGAGTKRARVDVGRLARGQLTITAQLEAPRAGVASPRACSVVEGAPRVVAWLDRGATLPGELWLFTSGGATLLLAPAPGEAVEVYGVLDAPAARAADGARP